MTYFLCWARIGDSHAHSLTPTVADLEAQGWRVVGQDERYTNSVLMRKDEKGEEESGE